MVYTVCIGSNEQRHANLAFARKRLSECFPGIRFSHEVDTQPLSFRRSTLFANQVARFTSDLPQKEVCSCLKGIEREAGRRVGDKELEIVKLDIDLLACDDRVCKPEDWARDYVMRGLQELDKP